jgi:hypothetical protein
MLCGQITVAGLYDFVAVGGPGQFGLGMRQND